MKIIFKTWKKSTYLKGDFQLRDNSITNWANPIEFPTVFVAYGSGITSGNWQRCTNINTPQYVIDNYFDTIGTKKHHSLFNLFEMAKKLENIKWSDVEEDKKNVLNLIDLANNELLKLQKLNNN